MRKKAITVFLILTFLVLIAVFALLAYLPLQNQQPNPNSSLPTITTTLATPSQTTNFLISQFKIDLENPAAILTIANGKIFVVDKNGAFYCFNAQNGNSIWKIEGGYGTTRGPEIVYYEGKVYTGSRGGILKAYDAQSGQELPLEYQAPVSSSHGLKDAPSAFSVVDGKVFVSSDGCAAYNLYTGELLWKTLSPSQTQDPNMPYTQVVWPFKANLFLASNFRSAIYRIDPDNGSMLWPKAMFSNTPPLVAGEQVILWNSGPTEQERYELASVDAYSGEKLWSFNVGATMHQPVVFGDLVLFVANDGYLYAVNISDGKLKWQASIDMQNLITNYYGHSDYERYELGLSLSVFPLQIDKENSMVICGFSAGKNFSPSSYAFSFNQTDGRLIWTTSLSDSVSEVPENLASPTDSIYIVAPNELFSIDKMSGQIQGKIHFNNKAFQPIVEDNSVFVAVDNKIFAFTK